MLREIERYKSLIYTLVETYTKNRLHCEYQHFWTETMTRNRGICVGVKRGIIATQVVGHRGNFLMMKLREPDLQVIVLHLKDVNEIEEVNELLKKHMDWRIPMVAYMDANNMEKRLCFKDQVRWYKPSEITWRRTTMTASTIDLFAAYGIRLKVRTGIWLSDHKVIHAETNFEYDLRKIDKGFNKERQYRRLVEYMMQHSEKLGSWPEQQLRKLTINTEKRRSKLEKPWNDEIREDYDRYERTFWREEFKRLLEKNDQNMIAKIIRAHLRMPKQPLINVVKIEDRYVLLERVTEALKKYYEGLYRSEDELDDLIYEERISDAIVEGKNIKEAMNECKRNKVMGTDCIRDLVLKRRKTEETEVATFRQK